MKKQFFAVGSASIFFSMLLSFSAAFADMDGDATSAEMTEGKIVAAMTAQICEKIKTLESLQEQAGMSSSAGEESSGVVHALGMEITTFKAQLSDVQSGRGNVDALYTEVSAAVEKYKKVK